MKDIIIFDHDGVIANSLESVISIYNDLSQKYGLKKIRNQEEFTDFFNDNFFKGLDQAGIRPEVSSALLKDMTEHLAENPEEIPVFSGIKEVLSDLSKDYKLMIITSNISQVINRFLQSHGIKEIEKVVGADKEKSKVKKIQKVKQDHPESRIYYVGDTVGDIYEGKKAEVTTVAASWGFHSKDKLADSLPDHLIESPKELLGIFS